jgi:hypothetical protein
MQKWQLKNASIKTPAKKDLPKMPAENVSYKPPTKTANQKEQHQPKFQAARFFPQRKIQAAGLSPPKFKLQTYPSQ